MRTFLRKRQTGSLTFLLCAAAVIASLSLTPLNITHAQQTTNCTTTASGCYTLLAPLPGISPNSSTIGSPITSVSITTYLQYMFNLIIALASVAAVFMITWGGFLYMTSEALPSKQDGLKKVRDAIYGLLLVLCSWLILRTIDPRLINIPPTFVPQLTLSNCGPTNTSGCAALNSLTSGLTQTNNQQLAQQTSITQANIASLQTQQSNLQGQIAQFEQDGDAPTDPEVAQAQAQVDNLQNKINQQRSDQALQQDQTVLQQAMTSGINSNLTLPQAIANIDAANETALNQLQPLGTQPAGNSTNAQLLNDQTNYAEGILTVQNYCVQGAGTLASIGGGVSGAFSSPVSLISPVIGVYYGVTQAQVTAAQNNIKSNVLATNAFPITDPTLKSQLSQYAQQAVSSGCTSISNVPPIPVLPATSPSTSP